MSFRPNYGFPAKIGQGLDQQGKIGSDEKVGTKLGNPVQIGSDGKVPDGPGNQNSNPNAGAAGKRAGGPAGPDQPPVKTVAGSVRSVLTPRAGASSHQYNVQQTKKTHRKIIKTISLDELFPNSNDSKEDIKFFFNANGSQSLSLNKAKELCKSEKWKR